MPKKAIDNVAIMSDSHCGSWWGWTPPRYWNALTPPGVKWLWECRKKQLRLWPKRLDMLILNGDHIDGKQRRSEGTSVVSTSLAVQTDMAIECYEPFVERADIVVRVGGTAYHESFDGPLEKLDMAFGIKKPKDPIDCLVRDIRLSKDCLINVKHKPEGGACLYKLTAVDREALWASVMEQHANLENADYLIRSHFHNLSGPARAFNKVIVGTPCWCLQQPYAVHSRYYRYQPDVGSVLLQRHKLGFKGYVILDTTFPLPPREGKWYDEDAN